MNEHRQSAIEGLFRLLHETRDELLSGRRGCGYECSSIMYGALSKQMQSDALLSPRPAAPYPSLTYKSLVQRVSSFKSPQWCGPSSHYARYQHRCPASSFETLFGELKDIIEGLDLEDLIH
jgi:hypothetical protein